MPEKTRTYKRVIFTPEAIKKAESVLVTNLPENAREMTTQFLEIRISSEEKWDHDSEDEFFADYVKGFERATYDKRYNWGAGKIHFYISRNDTDVSVLMPDRITMERVFNTIESFVEECRLPRETKKEPKIPTDWISETIDKVKSRCPMAGRKLNLALSKLESNDVEDWQNATMLIRDAWIELTQWLCKVKNIDTSDIPEDSVIDRLKKLNINRTDEKLFNLAKASFNLYSKHHKRTIESDTAIACVISTVVSMQTIIREVF